MATATNLINSAVRPMEMVIGARYGRRIHVRLMHAAERVLLRRVTGRCMRSPLSTGVFLGAIQHYYSHFMRT